MSVHTIREGETTMEVSTRIIDALEDAELVYYCEEDACWHHDYDIVVMDDLNNSRAWRIIEERIAIIETDPARHAAMVEAGE